MSYHRSHSDGLLGAIELTVAPGLVLLITQLFIPIQSHAVKFTVPPNSSQVVPVQA